MRRALLAVLVACAATVSLPGCFTLYLWDQDIGWWPLARHEYESVEAASIDADGRVYVCLSLADASVETYVADLPAPYRQRRADWFTSGLSVIGEPGGPTFLPRSAVPIKIPPDGRIDSVRHGPWRSSSIAEGDVAAGLEGFDRNAAVVFVGPGPVDPSLVMGLPRPPVAWDSANAIGHVAATPFAVALDVALSPVYAVVLVLWGFGRIETH